MDKILYCAAPFSTYNAKFLYTQEPDEIMFEKNKEIIEVVSKYNLRMDIKVHPSGEKNNFAHFSYLAKNYPNIKVIGGYWKWFLRAERLIPKYDLVIIDIIRTAILPVMARSTIPTIIYTKKDLREFNIGGLKHIFHMATTKKRLDELIKKFSFGELYVPENEKLLKVWFKKRETIENWYKIGRKDMFLRRRFRHEWKNDNIPHLNFEKIWKRLKRIKNPPLAGKT